MSRPRDPEAEKNMDYERQSRSSSGESRHAERKNRPKRRARAHRAERRGVQQALDVGVGRFDPDQTEQVMNAVAEVPIPYFIIWPPLSLGDHLADRRRYRAAEAGRIFFRETYNSARHRVEFARFLQAVVDGGVAPSKELAEHFADQRWSLRRDQFLEAFFRDEPKWRGRLERWIAKTLES